MTASFKTIEQLFPYSIVSERLALVDQPKYFERLPANELLRNDTARFQLHTLLSHFILSRSVNLPDAGIPDLRSAADHHVELRVLV